MVLRIVEVIDLPAVGEVLLHGVKSGTLNQPIGTQAAFFSLRFDLSLGLHHCRETSGSAWRDLVGVICKTWTSMSDRDAAAQLPRVHDPSMESSSRSDAMRSPSAGTDGVDWVNSGLMLAACVATY